MTTGQTLPAGLPTAVTGILNAHDLLGVLNLGAPEDEYDPEARDFAALIAAGVPITADTVASTWHKWFGDPSKEPGPPTAQMAALAADLQKLSAARHCDSATSCRTGYQTWSRQGRPGRFGIMLPVRREAADG